MGDITECMTCGSTRLAQVLDLGAQSLAERESPAYPLAVQQCAECGLAQLTYEVPRAEVFPDDHPYATGNTQALRQHFAKLAEFVLPVADQGNLIADIGASDGTFLAEVLKRSPGAQVLAIEPTATGAAGCRARGVPVEQQPFTRKLAVRLRRDHGPAAVITASNVMAHVSSQHDFLSGVSHWLSEAGTFIAENHDWASVVNGLQIDTVYHEHLRFYSPASFGYVLSMHGLLPHMTDRIPTHGGSFRTYAMHEQRGLQARADAAYNSLNQLLDTCARPVYGIGAATRATPLIHWAGIQEYLSKVCEVSTSAKIGTLIPGTGIPVVDEAELIKDQPPTALLLAWHIADSVVPKLRDMGYKGQFIVPLPEARIYEG